MPFNMVTLCIDSTALDFLVQLRTF